MTFSLTKPALALAFLFLMSAVAFTTTPSLVNYQGKLTEPGGEPVADSVYAMTFTIFDAAEGGQAVWNEVQSDVAVMDGLFAVNLGTVVALPDSIFADSARFLEVSVAGQTLSPRTRFTSVGYAHRISTVDGASGGSVSGSVQINPTVFPEPGNALVIGDGDGSAVVEITVDEFDNPTISLYDPADSKGSDRAGLKLLELGVLPDGSVSASFYDPADSKAGIKLLELGVLADGHAAASFYEPADSKDPSLAGLKILDVGVMADGVPGVSFYDPADAKAGVDDPRVELRRDGLIMYGETIFDTSLFVAPNGDIIGLGQITMGENSSDGENTAVLGFNNTASGDSSSIGGGSANVAAGASSVIGGGFQNTTNGTASTIGGGSTNSADGAYATIAGGFENSADGDYGTVPGGEDNSADAAHTFAAGRHAKAEHAGTFVWADHTDEPFVSTAEDQFIIRASGGVGIGTNNPSGVLEIASPDGDNAIIFPDDAISAPELLDEPGLSNDRSGASIVLPQDASTMTDLAVTTITIPADGYVMVRGGATLKTTGSHYGNQALFQIDEYPGGSEVAPYFGQAGSSFDYDKAGGETTTYESRYYAVSAERIFFKPAGTYEFRFEARAGDECGYSAVTTMQRPHITALFIPSAYGVVADTDQ